MTASAQGVDTSSFQAPLVPGILQGLDFAFAKATNGPGGTDPDFPASWGAIAEAGLPRGAYHELTPDDPVEQAGHFMTVVRAAGLRPGDMLACVASDYPVTGAQAGAFLTAVSGLSGPQNPVLLYSDLSALPGLAECTGYPLWIAFFSDSAPGSVAPWPKWTFWQWRAGGGADGGDTDAFNGTAADLAAFIASYVSPAPPADWVFGLVLSLDVVSAGPHSVKLSWSPPAVPMPLAVGKYEVAVTLAGSAADIPSYPRYEAQAGEGQQEWQGGSLTPSTEYTAWVRAIATDGGHASPWEKVTFTTPAA